VALTGRTLEDQAHQVQSVQQTTAQSLLTLYRWLMLLLVPLIAAYPLYVLLAQSFAADGPWTKFILLILFILVLAWAIASIYIGMSLKRLKDRMRIDALLIFIIGLLGMLAYLLRMITLAGSVPAALVCIALLVTLFFISGVYVFGFNPSVKALFTSVNKKEGNAAKAP
jgi:FtsH-binding integral membrane protein